MSLLLLFSLSHLSSYLFFLQNSIVSQCSPNSRAVIMTHFSFHLPIQPLLLQSPLTTIQEIRTRRLCLLRLIPVASTNAVSLSLSVSLLSLFPSALTRSERNLICLETKGPLVFFSMLWSKQGATTRGSRRSRFTELEGVVKSCYLKISNQISWHKMEWIKTIRHSSLHFRLSENTWGLRYLLNPLRGVLSGYETFSV